MEEQINILKDKGIPFINSIHSQKELLNAIHCLQRVKYGNAYDNDEVFASYLFLEEYEKAKNIVLNYWAFWKIPEEAWESLNLLKKYAYSNIDNIDYLNEFQIQHVYERNWNALQSIYQLWQIVKKPDRMKSLSYDDTNIIKEINIELI